MDDDRQMLRLPRLVPLCLWTALAIAQPRYELLLKGGHVIDPKNNIDAVMDVAIAGGKIAQVAADIPAAQSQKTVNVKGLYVTPGLVDVHVHVYASTGQKGAYSGDNSVYPDGFTFRSGVTTVVDAGSSGWRNFPDFKDRVIDRSKTRVLAMLNIVGRGMGGGAIEQNPEDMDPEATAQIARQYPQTVVGIKTAHYAAPEWVAVERALAAAKLAGVPLMVDFGFAHPTRTLKQLVLDYLRPGDISTHMYGSAQPIVDRNKKVQPYYFEARKRGVKFDVGHGGGSFWWNDAVPSIQQGWVPDTISTDLHISSMNNAMKDMATTMSKILSLGVPLKDVIRMSTLNGATEFKRPDIGHLSIGAGADVAVLRLDKGQFGYLDVRNTRLIGNQKLTCEMTLRDGKVVWDLSGRAGEDWEAFYARPENQRDEFNKWK